MVVSRNRSDCQALEQAVEAAAGPVGWLAELQMAVQLVVRIVEQVRVQTELQIEEAVVEYDRHW